MPMSGQSLIVVLPHRLGGGLAGGQDRDRRRARHHRRHRGGDSRAFIAAWLLPKLGLRLGSGIVRQIIDATLGAVILLALVRLVRRP
jgi:hypothetical protein